MADFPSQRTNGRPLRPTDRSYSFGRYPTKPFRALSGAVVRRSFGNRAFEHTLDLQFANVPEDAVALIWDHYHEQQGDSEGFALPSTVLDGMQGAMAARLKQPANVLWHYAEAPTVQDGKAGLSTMSVRLVSELA